MLLTRCPSCRTTFRITHKVLRIADGRVRCGRCQAVFDAYAALGKRNQSAQQPAPDADTPTTYADPTEGRESAPPTTGSGSASALPEVSDETFGELSLREILEHVERGGDDEVEVDDTGHAAPEPADPDPDPAPPASPGSGQDGQRSHHAGPGLANISEQQVEEVLARGPGEWPVPLSWKLEQQTRKPPPSRWWRYAAAAAALLLAAQTVHHFRTDLAARPAVGPRIQQAYAWFGMPIVPSWDVQQYRIMDWVATAEPDGNGSLNITARIHNRGPRAQPYPYVHLQLKDRWERPVGSRVFTPNEYMPADARVAALMAPGDTMRAHLEIVDPGTDASGFELDVCVQVEGGGLTCAADAVFR